MTRSKLAERKTAFQSGLFEWISSRNSIQITLNEIKEMKEIDQIKLAAKEKWIHMYKHGFICVPNHDFKEVRNLLFQYLRTHDEQKYRHITEAEVEAEVNKKRIFELSFMTNFPIWEYYSFTHGSTKKRAVLNQQSRSEPSDIVPHRGIKRVSSTFLSTQTKFIRKENQTCVNVYPCVVDQAVSSTSVDTSLTSQRSPASLISRLSLSICIISEDLLNSPETAEWIQPRLIEDELLI